MYNSTPTTSSRIGHKSTRRIRRSMLMVIIQANNKIKEEWKSTGMFPYDNFNSHTPLSTIIIIPGR